MNCRKDAERVEYYRQQASACATAALATAIAELKQAYLELEEAWLCLAPKPKEDVDGSPADAETWDGTSAPEAGPPPKQNAVAVGNRRDGMQEDNMHP